MTSQTADATTGRSKPTSMMWSVLLGWVLLRLITLGERSNRSSALAGDSRSSSSADPFLRHGGDASTTREAGRGREADKPTEIPARGWKDILWRVYERLQKDRILLVAAGVTFYALLAIFPAIAALVSIYGLFADPGVIQSHLATLSGILPGGALEIIGEEVKRIASKGSGTLGFSFAVSLAISLWSANAGIKSIFDALNIVYREEEKRSFLTLNVISLAFTVGAILFLLLALGAVVVVPIALTYLGLGSSAEWLIAILPWLLLLAGLIFGLALVYRYGPSRDDPKWRWITPGGTIAAILWMAVSMLFSWYTANFGSYNATYGSLGAAIGFMTWIWLSTIIILLGAEINAETEHQTAKDTTKGAPQPLGMRGATMADTVGEAKS